MAARHRAFLTFGIPSGNPLPIFRAILPGEMAADLGLADFPAVCIMADVCKEELLFEIDAEAAVRKGSGCGLMAAGSSPT